ncbi:MAG: FAD-binding oxidoreductase [Rhizobiaceae bacterium]|nr:FAD-binding oxidoreductase [Rhizobiaceae bacterium]
MPASRILIVGAGIIGASIALHLVRRGCSVTVLDDLPEPGGLATANSFAWINASWGNPQRYFQFRRRSMQGWKRLAETVPGLTLNWCGGLLWDLPADRLQAYADEHGAWGYGVRWVERSEITALEPSLRAPPQRALHIAEEGVAEPRQAACALLAAAVDAGARVRSSSRVAELRTVAGRVRGVRLADGEVLDADDTVIAAGTESARLLETAGVRLRMSAPAGLIAHSTIAARRLLNGLVMTPEFHVRQTGEGRLIAGSDFAGGDPGSHAEEAARQLIARLRTAIDGAENLDLDFATVGHRPTPADGYPAIGRPAAMAGLYVAVLHSGITLAPVVGDLAAREISGLGRDADLAPYDPGRPELA